MGRKQRLILFLSVLCLFFCFAQAGAQKKNDDASFETFVEAGDTARMADYLSKAKPEEKIKMLNAVYINGRTPLMYAVEEKNSEMIKFLAENGADVNLAVNGYYPFAAAVADEEKSITDYLDSTGELSKESYDAALLEAAGPLLTARNPQERKENIAKVKRKDNIDLFKRLAAKSGGIKINEAQLLMRAADNGNTAILSYLLANGANPQAKEKNYGFTPLFWAVSSGSMETVKILLNAGADINAKSTSAITPLFLTIENTANEVADAANIEMMKYLIAAGADMNAFSALPFSVELKGIKILSYLLSKGADAKSAAGGVALMTALNAQNYEAANLLKRYGASAKKAGNRLPLKYRRFRY